MKSGILLLVAPLLFSRLKASELFSFFAPPNSDSLEESPLEVEGSSVWPLKKAAELESTGGIGSTESNDITINPGPISTSIDPLVLSKLSVPSSDASKESIESPSHDELLVTFTDAIRQKNYNHAKRLLKIIPNWKMTTQSSNLSVLSVICMYAKDKFLGRLSHPNVIEIFAPLFNGKYKNMSGGYLAALSLFRSDIQVHIVRRLIEIAPHLRGFLLQASIYYSLNESVVELLLKSGAVISFTSNIEFYPLSGIPSLKFNSSSDEQQLTVSPRLFMNFYEPVHFFSGLGGRSTSDPEISFLTGMMENCVPAEVGVLRVAFESYRPEIFMALFNLSPSPRMSSYHLAHMLAKRGTSPSDSAYTSIDELVAPQIVLKRLIEGKSDLVALVFLSRLPGREQLSIIAQFMAKTKIFDAYHIHNPRTITSTSSKAFKEETGLYELPSSPADVFFLTACKWNIDDEAFELIYRASKKIANRQFWVAKRAALDWATRNNLTRKMDILS